ncbi:MAG: CarD family transcriptional regulator [Bacilli bacterium]|nr:CarD family transcriptional regulator [Bacilli bacterium]MBO6285148.1 CarD family transcriptional regulator [Bacilli bacterium]
MYDIDTYVFHTHCGVCKVLSIEPLSGDDSGALYYVLAPFHGDDKNNIVRVPVDNPASLRKPLSKELAIDLIHNWPNIRENLYVTDSKQRKIAYENALRSGLVEDLAALMEGALQRKARDGHLNSMDSQFLARAQPIVYGELGFALNMPVEDVPNYIRENAKNK